MMITVLCRQGPLCHSAGSSFSTGKWHKVKSLAVVSERCCFVNLLRCCCAAAVVLVLLGVQAQGLCQLLGGREALVGAIQQHGVVLAAHGPYTAAGASEVLGVPVPVVSQNFSTFHGLVAALAEAL
jgi:hypothetical protein